MSHAGAPTDNSQIEAINGWVKEKTNGKIDSIIEETDFEDLQFDEINYYHEQDGKNYKCALSVDSQVFNVVIVSPVNI